jgi:transcriptional regulator with XRE-family HTH domain
MADSYGSRFRACRRALGLTQDELATKLDMSRSSMANIEADRQRSLIDDVERYADVFGVDPAWLAFGRMTVEGKPLPKPRTVASADLVKLSNNLQALAVRAMKLSSVADPDEVEEVPLASALGVCEDPED